jgi:hypothetical protein
MSITGTVMVFTPLLPIGIGLLAGGAGMGVSTSVGDAIGQHVQKTDMRKALLRLSECESRVIHLIEALVATCFPDVPPEDWAAARGAGISFNALPPDALASIGVAVGTAATRTAASVATRVGALAAARVFSVLGAVVSSGDFVLSMLTNNPNRKSIDQVSSFIEGKTEQYRIWLVLLHHWLELPVPTPASPAGTAAGAATGGGASPTAHSQGAALDARLELLRQSKRELEEIVQSAVDEDDFETAEKIQLQLDEVVEEIRAKSLVEQGPATEQDAESESGEPALSSQTSQASLASSADQEELSRRLRESVMDAVSQPLAPASKKPR